MNLLDAIRTQNPKLASELEATYAAPGHYQAELGDWIRVHRPKIFVETGVLVGFSSDRILTALDDVGQGHLYSVDPNPRGHLFDIKHPRWTTYRMTSMAAMVPIFSKTGPWDVFLHDSDHEVFCTTYEYELAWSLVRAGGWIMSDDSTWGTPPHLAWQRFCERHDVQPFTIGHACAAIQKPETAPAVTSVKMAESADNNAFYLAKQHLDEYTGRTG